MGKFWIYFAHTFFTWNALKQLSGKFNISCEKCKRNFRNSFIICNSYGVSLSLPLSFFDSRSYAKLWTAACSCVTRPTRRRESIARKILNGIIIIYNTYLYRYSIASFLFADFFVQFEQAIIYQWWADIPKWTPAFFHSKSLCAPPPPPPVPPCPSLLLAKHVWHHHRREQLQIFARY